MQDVVVRNCGGKILQDIVVGKSCGKSLRTIVVGKSGSKLLQIILREIVVCTSSGLTFMSGKSCGKLLQENLAFTFMWENLVGNSCE